MGLAWLGRPLLRIEDFVNKVVQGIRETFTERGFLDVLSDYEFVSDPSQVGCRNHAEFSIGCKVCLLKNSSSDVRHIKSRRAIWPCKYSSFTLESPATVAPKYADPPP